MSFSSAFAAPPTTNATVPQTKDKCPVCGMFVSKYPDWVATVTFKDSSTLYFDGAKDFFTYYHNMQKFTPSKKQTDISAITVNDYYTLKPIDARKASFVIGSDVYGPMGKELVPFEKTADSIAFIKDHRGKKILHFGDITQATIRYLE
jgi:nitrous oxide reductase accessory protein NosL